LALSERPVPSPPPISPDQWRQLEALVDLLLDTPPERRAALLAELSAGDPVRRAELERLVAECERAHPLLDRPAAERFAALVDDHAVRASEVLADRYRITREIGRGGMATVYLARDVRHSRDVAVKVVRADLAAALGAARFLREIEIVAALRHPHIVPLYDSGETGGILYYVMPYEDGRSLRERLARDGRLGIDDAVLILRDVCDALAYAHRQGIVHRDIKPDNVLLSGRHAMVTDFGVAKALAAGVSPRQDHADVPRGVAAITTAGVSLGTPTYMAPEQVAADPRIDHRADIYALGALAYELVAGRPPFQSDEPQLVLAAHLTEKPAPVSAYRPDVPPDLANLVMKCLEKRPVDRWQSADELVTRLERVLSASATSAAPQSDVGSAVATDPRPTRTRASTRWRPLATALGATIAVASLAFAVSRARNPVATAPGLDPGRIVVVPFRLSGVEASRASLAESVVDLLSAKLNGEGGPLAVDSRTAISAWNRVRAGQDGTADHARRVARMSGAAEALSGTIVGVSRDHVTLTANVIPAVGGAVLPVATATGHIDSLPALLDLVAVRLVARQAGVNERTLASLAGVPVPAIRAYLWGRAEHRKGQDAKAIRHFARAIDLDSTFALAALDLAVASGQPLGLQARCPANDCLTTFFALGYRNPGPESEHRRLSRAVQVAWRYREKLGPQDRPLVEALHGDSAAERNTAKAIIAKLQRAATAAPERAETQYLLGALLLYQGLALEMVDSRARAAAAFRSALEIDPAYVAPLAGLVEVAGFDRDSAELRRAGARYLARDSTGALADYVRWRVAIELGDSTTLSAIRARFDSLESSTLQRIVQASVLTGLDLSDAERAVTLVIDRASDRIERSIALGSAYMLAMNRGRPRAAAALLRRRSMERDDVLSTWTWAAMAAMFWDGDSALARSAVTRRAEVIARDTLPGARPGSLERLQLSRHISQQGLWDLMHGDTARAAAAVRWLRRSDHPLGADFVDALIASRAGRPDAAVLRARLDSVALEGCCPLTIVSWANLVVGRAHEEAGRDADALRAMRRGVWRFPPQLLSTFLRNEGRLAAKLGDRAGAIRAYRHYLALRSDPEPELMSEVERVRRELERLEKTEPR
jgi:eukaryotic-like serine/threonine-protein kinase